MSSPCRVLVALVFGLCGPLNAQEQRWIWQQRSEWQPDGVPLVQPAVAETTLMLAMPARAVPPRRLESITLTALNEDPSAPLTLSVRLGRDGRVAGLGVDLDGKYLRDFDQEAPFGSMLQEARAFLVPAPVRRDALEDHTRARYVVARRVSSILGDTIGGDTLTLVRHRRGRVTERVTREGRAWLRIHATGHDTLTAVRFIENSFERTRVDVMLAGPVEETYLLEPASGRVDSLRQDLRWQGRIRYAGPRGPVVTVPGQWRAERTAIWQPDPRADEGAAMEYFMVHGRYPPADSAQPATLESRLVERGLRGDTTVLDTALALRASASTLAERIQAARLVAHMAWVVSRDRRGDLAQEPAIRHFSPADPLWPTLLPKYDQGKWVSATAARVLTAIFSRLETQRRLGLNRQEAFSALLDLISDPDSITAEAADILAEGARHADDPSARDLFLLGAYRGRPAQYLTLTDSFPHGAYRPIVRRFTRGDFRLAGYTWGVTPELDSTTKAEDQPGLAEPWQAHEQRAGGSQGAAPNGWFREWLEAHEPGWPARLHELFAREPDPRGRLVWAQYLLVLGDTTPVRWMQEVVQAEDSALAEVAYRAMNRLEWQDRFADTLRAGPELAELQEMLLNHTMGERLLTENGDTVWAFSPHDETPGEHLLLTEGLDPTILASPRWRDRFEFITLDALTARADTAGLIMAMTLRPVIRIGKYYQTGVDLQPFGPPGTMCLCGGTSFTLVRREGRWVIVDSGSWIS